MTTYLKTPFYTSHPAAGNRLNFIANFQKNLTIFYLDTPRKRVQDHPALNDTLLDFTLVCLTHFFLIIKYLNESEKFVDS